MSQEEKDAAEKVKLADAKTAEVKEKLADAKATISEEKAINRTAKDKEEKTKEELLEEKARVREEQAKVRTAEFQQELLKGQSEQMEKLKEAMMNEAKETADKNKAAQLEAAETLKKMAEKSAEEREQYKKEAADNAVKVKEAADKKEAEDKKQSAKDKLALKATLDALKTTLEESKEATLEALVKTEKVGANGDSREAAIDARREVWNRVEKKRGWKDCEADVTNCLALLWDKYDVDGSDDLSRDELVPLVQEVAEVQVRHLKSELKKFQKEHDKQTNKVLIETSKYMALAYRTAIKDNQRIVDNEDHASDRVHSVFDLMDENHDGSLSKDEFTSSATATFFTDPEALIKSSLENFGKEVKNIKLEKAQCIVTTPASDGTTPEPAPASEK